MSHNHFKMSGVLNGYREVRKNRNFVCFGVLARLASGANGPAVAFAEKDDCFRHESVRGGARFRPFRGYCRL